MSRTKANIFAIASLALSALFVIGLLSFAGPCSVHDDGSVSPCFPTSHVLIGLGIAAVLAAVVRLPFRNRTVGLVCDVVGAALGAAIAVAPGTFLDLCMMTTMRCHAIMRPFAMVMGALLVVCAIVDIVSTRNGARAEGSPRPPASEPTHR